MLLNVGATAACSICCHSAGVTAASLKMKPSIVAMSGMIMPLPFTIPTIITRVPATMALAVAALGKVSVVPMALVAASQSAWPSAAWACVTPDSARSTGSGTPITPVEALNTWSGLQPSTSATRAACALAASRPDMPVKALLLPALTISPRAWPCGSLARHNSTSGDGHFDCVVTPATTVPGASSTSVTQSRVHFL